ncbi:hypothetical protein BDN72DRAFT_907181 [Pluteus cervinus]|uniref:Uncharacterized protein n=1 Tax=Pluteus cervinus TaxID=181527 RepID=A0ACD2ZZE3_9AGAR|nr:hypothetical protein BDN72DRAFT_907181 [Pluteus cervinus]
MRPPLLSSSLAILLTVQENAAPLQVLENPIPASNPSNNASPTFRFSHVIHSATAAISTVACAKRSLPFPTSSAKQSGYHPLPPTTNTAMTRHRQGSTATGGGSGGSWSVLPPSEPLDPFVKIDPETTLKSLSGHLDLNPPSP